MFNSVGQLLSRYKSGPLPKAFKILPSLQQWPILLSITNPESWTPHALLAATRIFASNLDPKQSQRFYRDFLSDRIREEIAMEKKLNVHSYQALKKALYKPAAFFKGFLFPLCEVSCFEIACVLSFESNISRFLRAEHVHYKKLSSLAPSCKRSPFQCCTLALHY